MSLSEQTTQALITHIYKLQRGLRHATRRGTGELPYALEGILALTAAAPGTRPKDLAADIGVSPSVMSRQVSDLIDAGFLERRRDPSDGRACRLHITETGASQLEHARRLRSDALRLLLADWDEQHAAGVIDAMSALARAISPSPAAPSSQGQRIDTTVDETKDSTKKEQQ